MGSFFTSTQIYNPNRLRRDQFIDFFREEMKKNGYVSSNSDESEASYILRLADGCKWVTITSEAYEQGNQFSQTDTGRIAKMLKTVCINTTVIDSDCATLDFYDESGKKKDSLIMGRADDYFGDDIPKPLESVWTPFLEGGYGWKQLLDVRNGDYVFVEEGLAELASIIGLDSEGILFSADGDNGDEHSVMLCFKKISTKMKRPATFAAAFKDVCNEMLIPKGFSLLKSKHPYYVRTTNEGIVQTVSFAKIKTFNPNAEGFTICIGLSLITLPLTNFELQPMALGQTWMRPMIDFLHSCSLYLKDFYNPQVKKTISYQKGDSDSMLNAIEVTRAEDIPFILEFFDTYSTLEDMYRLGEKMIPGLYEDVVILLQRINEYINAIDAEFSDSIKNFISVLENNPMMHKIAEREKLDLINRHESRKKRLLLHKIGEAEYEIYTTQAIETKKANYSKFNELIEE